MFGLNLGQAIEAALEDAGQVIDDCQMVGFTIPGLKAGHITADITQTSPLFAASRKGASGDGQARPVVYANCPFVLGPRVPANGYEPNGNTPWRDQYKCTQLALFPFITDGETLLQLGGLIRNRLVVYECLECGRTYGQKRELTVRHLGNRFSCDHCFKKRSEEFMQGKGAKLRPEEARREKNRLLAQAVLTHQTGYKEDTLRPELNHQAELSLKAGPHPGFFLPRPFVMFKPGACLQIWEPAIDDEPGKVLALRCGNAEQVPMPLALALKVYNAKPNQPVVFAGMIGIHLLVAQQVVGWVKELRAEDKRDGWDVRLPLDWEVATSGKAREV